MNINDDTPIDSEIFSKWLMSMPLRERKQKIERLVKKLGIQKRAIEKWRQGKIILPKHHSGIRDVMRGLDKINVEFEPHVYAAFEKKAAEHNKTVMEYLNDLGKLLLVALVGVLGWSLTKGSKSEPAVLAATSPLAKVARKQREKDPEEE